MSDHILRYVQYLTRDIHIQTYPTYSVCINTHQIYIYRYTNYITLDEFSSKAKKSKIKGKLRGKKNKVDDNVNITLL